MAAPSVTYTFINGTSADAAQVNTNFTDLINGASDGTKDYTINDLTTNGNTIIGSAVTDTLVVTARSTFTKSVKIVSPGYTSNLGLSLSAGVLTIVGSDGAALSSANPGWVTVPATTAGLYVTLKVTSGGVIRDAASGSSDFTGYEFGITSTSNWANDMPFFIYVVNRADSDLDGVDGSSQFFISRSPSKARTRTATTDIGDTGAVPATDSQRACFIMNDVTIANYATLPSQVIGAFRMQYATATNDWTIQTLGINDGIGTTQLMKTFSNIYTMPLAQNGAASGTHMKANGGTAPVFSTQTITYQLLENGTCRTDIFLTGDGGTDGAGAVTAQVSLPYSANDVANVGVIGAGSVITSVRGTEIMRMDVSSTSLELTVPDGTAILNSDFGNGGRTISCVAWFKVFSDTV